MLSLVRISDFAAARDAWRQLSPRSPHPNVFTSYDWQATWWQFFGQDAELFLWALWEDDHLRGIAPLMKHDGLISLVGGRAVSDFLDFIVEPGYEPVILTAVIEKLKTEEWREVALRGLRPHSPTLELAPRLAQDEGWATEIEEEDVSPLIILPDNWETYVGSLPKKDRHELRRKSNRLNERASWQWQSLVGQSIGGDEMDDFLRLVRLSSTEKAAFMDERMARFFHTAIRGLATDGLARLYFMEIEGQRVSATVCFDQNDELWLYNSGFDPSFSALSVGLLLKTLCVDDAIKLNKKRFDFLRGREPYKYDLGAKDQPVYCLRIQRQSGFEPIPLHFTDER